MAQIRQVQVSFVPVEDRLLMRLASATGEEFRFWITRRYLRLLWPLLERLLASDPAVSAQASDAARHAMLSFRQEQALARADFSQEFTRGTTALPLGESPVLLARAQARPQPTGGCVLSLHPERGTGVELALGAELLHSINRLLAEAVGRAQWDIAPAAGRGEPAGGIADRTIN